MAKIESLHTLVNSLTKGEKRYFKMYSALQEGGKNYLHLFDLLENRTGYDAIKREFRRILPKASFEATSKYLFKVLTDCLLHIKLEQGGLSRLMVSLLKTNILFEKSMYEEGFRELKKTQHSCENNEHHLLHLWAIRMELNYRNSLNFNSLKERELLKKQLKIDELIQYYQNIHRHTSLYEQLRYRTLYKGAVRTKAQKEALNDLVVSEIHITSQPFADTFESKRIHLLFQANYFLSTGNIQSALDTFYELNTLLEKHKHLWADSPMDYISAAEGILDSLHTIGHYDEMKFFIERLDRLQGLPGFLDVMVKKIIFIYSAVSLLNSGRFDEAIELQKNFEDRLFKKLYLLDLNKQAEVYLYASLIYFGKGKITKAHYYLNKILLESKLYKGLPVFRTFRILHLLIHYELGNHDYILSETRSIKRAIKAEKTKTYLLEKVIFEFVLRENLPKSEKTRASYWGKIESGFSAIRSEKYEMQVLKIFDFQSWIYSRIFKTDLGELLRSISPPVAGK